MGPKCAIRSGYRLVFHLGQFFMNDFYHILLALGDRTFREWAHEMVIMVGEPEGDDLADPEEIHEAIDDFKLFIEEMLEEDDRLRSTFMHYLSLVGEENRGFNDAVSRRLRRRSQPFVGPFNVFDDESVGALKLSISGKAERFNVQSPSDEDLEKYLIPDIERGANLMRRHIEALRGAALGGGVHDYLDRIDGELEAIASRGDRDPAQDRRRIWEIEWMAAGAVELLNMSDEGFIRHSREKADALESWLASMPERDSHAVSTLVTDIRTCLDGDAIGGRLRDMVVEAHVVLAELCFSEEQRSRALETVDFQHTFDGISKFVYECMMVGAPETAVSIVRQIKGDSALASSALLDASYRYRLRNSGSTLLDVITPVLRRTRIGVSPDANGKDSYPPPTSLLDDRLIDAMLTLRLPELIGQEMPLFLEFGGGWTPYGLDVAVENSNHIVLSIDPDYEPVKKRFNLEGEMPPNFVPLIGRAEDTAPFAAEAAFANGAVMVSPPAESLNSMILSALLAVKPGRYVNVYTDAFLKSDLGWIEQAGFDIVEDVLRPDDPTLPTGDRLSKYQGVRHIRISVNDLEVDGANAPGSRCYKLKGLHGISPLGGRSKVMGIRKKAPVATDAAPMLASANGIGVASIMSAGLVAGMGGLRVA